MSIVISGFLHWNQALLQAGTFNSATENPVDFLLLILVIVAGLVFSAFFSGAEVAFFSRDRKVDDDTVRQAEKDRVLARVLYLLDKPRQLLATVLIGNTFANVVTAVGAAVLTGRLAVYVGFPPVVVFTVEVIVLTAIILILAEITPKVIALNKPLEMARRLSALLYVFFVLLGPVSRVISRITRALESSVPRPAESISTDDLKAIAEVGEEYGSIHGDEREIIENVIEFGHTTVREIMTSRVNIRAITTKSTLQEVLDLIREKGISRLPLCEDNLDQIVGIIHSKDLLPYINSDLRQTRINWKTLARKPLFVPLTKKIDDLLRDFQSQKTHIAIVVDEYGGTEGLITLDDVLEEIIGEISDEYSEPVELYTRKKSGAYLFDAKIDLDDMADILSVSLTTDQDEYETLGGLIYYLLERIPEVGETVIFKGLELKVDEMENNRLLRVEVMVTGEEETSTSG